MDQNLKTDAVTATKTLCGHLAEAKFSDLTPAALHEARRGVLDWIGCALAGSGSGGKGRMPKSSVGTLTFAVDTSAQPVSGAASMKA